MVTSPLMLNSIAAALHWFEVYCGLLLLAGVAVRGAALMLLVLLVSFSLVVLRRALVISATQGFPLCAVKFDCGCGTGEVVICHKLLENIALIVLSAWLTVWPRGWLCLRFCATKQAVADTIPAEFHPPPSASDRPTDDQAKPA